MSKDADDLDTMAGILDMDEDLESVDDDGVEILLDAQSDEIEEMGVGDPGWQDYVLSLLEDDEKAKGGAPKALGLLRVARQIFGSEAVHWTQDVHQATPEFAAVTVRLMYGNGDLCASAEAGMHNCDSPYNKYPLATAQTRALGRALKMALGINILTAEESSRQADLTIPVLDEERTEGSITDTQINFIDRMCKKHDLNVKTLVESVTGGHDSINELSHAEAIEVQEQLDTFAKEPPTDHEQYDADWKNTYFSEGK